jgi:hypothetical protein
VIWAYPATLVGPVKSAFRETGLAVPPESNKAFNGSCALLGGTLRLESLQGRDRGLAVLLGHNNTLNMVACLVGQQTLVLAKVASALRM